MQEHSLIAKDVNAVPLSGLLVAICAGFALAGPLDNQIKEATRPITTVDVKAQQAEAKVESKVEAKRFVPATLPTYFLQGRGEIPIFGRFAFDALFTRNADGTYQAVVRFVYDGWQGPLFGITTFAKDRVYLGGYDDRALSFYADAIPLVNTNYPLAYEYLPHTMRLTFDQSGRYGRFSGMVTTKKMPLDFSGTYEQRTLTTQSSQSSRSQSRSGRNLNLPKSFDSNGFHR